MRKQRGPSAFEEERGSITIQQDLSLAVKARSRCGLSRQGGSLDAGAVNSGPRV